MLKKAHINSTKSPMINQLYKLAEDNDAVLHLKISPILEKEDLSQLGEFIAKQKPFSFAKISLHVDLTL